MKTNDDVTEGYWWARASGDKPWQVVRIKTEMVDSTGINALMVRPFGNSMSYTMYYFRKWEFGGKIEEPKS